MPESKIFLLLLPLLVTGSPYSTDVEEMYSSDYDAPEELKEAIIVRTPTFESDSMSMLVNEGETVRLPCMVDRLEGFVLLWKREESILSAGTQIINPRYRMDTDTNGNQLVLSQVTPDDEGEYICQISSYDPKYLTHKLTVRVEPGIETTPGELLVVREGEPASLSCKILKGSPTPAVNWVRKHKPDQPIQGTVVQWNSVTRHDAGHYICQADNGFGPDPVTREVKLEVHHGPHIEIGEEFLHTAEGEEVRILCNIHCSPRCETGWSKDGVDIDPTNPNYYTNIMGNTHTLTILKMGSELFGDYTCTARNQIGEKTGTIQVSGLAHPAVFQDTTLSPWLDKFFLEWSVLSRSPVHSFTLEFRAEREFRWRSLEVKSAPKLENEWQGSITLEGLGSATRYEARVAARNQYGLSKFSKPFLFATKGAEPLQQPSVSGVDSLFISKHIQLFTTLLVVVNLL
ncbi:neural cell adhesion molecule 1 [Eurytemora carolleeae]|uniref:neural cell adhesion molecule 1 n=1 Tax=Eurytemora carolleeae TaxID=1294199 RepID=UPI000C785BD4|nr:neural cell adhesion molecule 1 [Eurytemora carolleeae]|eukprot:XP_023346513.1 neural cell adhesion molecule 1-like [Eurytemora affinis]